MLIETVPIRVKFCDLITNAYTPKWRDYNKSNVGLEANIKENNGRVYKRPFITPKGIIPTHPDKYVLLNGIGIVNEVVKQTTETEIDCQLIDNITEADILELVNTLNGERKLKDWEQCEQALEFLPPPQQGDPLGGTTRWRIALDKSFGSISEDTLQRYDRIKTFDKKTPFSIFFPEFCPQKQYDLIDRIKGIDCDKEPLTISDANTLVSRYTNKDKLKQKYPDKKLVVAQIYTDLIQDFHVWQQDNRQEWLIEDESIQLVCCSPHYFNQRKYTDEGIVYEPQTLAEYLHDLLLAFIQAKTKLKKDGVLCINIADTHKHGKNYMVVFRFCLDLADKLGLFFMFKQIWAKSNGLAKGREEASPVLDYEEILYFSSRYGSSTATTCFFVVVVGALATTAFFFVDISYVFIRLMSGG